ncbi:hypothetical protein J6O48_14050 [bacterium]|nr:hypothetical protein [bacterium]
MTREEKQQLLQDLCARLPYGVKIELTWWVMGEGTYINTTLEPDHIEQLLNDEDGDTEIKPYLRPISSMTKEEKEELRNTYSFLYSDYPFDNEYEDEDEDEDEDGIEGHYEPSPETYDWYNRKMFDYRGLILKGLALEAPDEMYK